MSAQDCGNNETNLTETLFPRQLYLRCPSKYAPSSEALGYTTGKTLGSGTYAKVKAAWSPFVGRMVRNISSFNVVVCKRFLRVLFRFCTGLHC